MCAWTYTCPGITVLLHVHPALIEQALFNILENAARFSPVNEPVRVIVRTEAGRLLVDVIDRGPGIPEDERARIFDMFYSVSRGDRGGQGTGLGLAICRGMIGAHGGRRRGFAQYGWWHDHSHLAALAATAGRPPMNPTAPRVLVIDDEAQIRRFLDIGLRAEGYQVFLATTGEEGLGLAATQSPDLVILDIGLPDREGHDVLRELRQWSQVPVLMLSVRDAEAEKVKSLDSGANDYVTKPFGIQELMARSAGAPPAGCEGGTVGGAGAIRRRHVVDRSRSTGGDPRRAGRRPHAQGVRGAVLARPPSWPRGQPATDPA